MPDSPEATLIEIQTGNAFLREQFLGDSLPLIRRIVRHLTRRPFVEQTDEFSLALEAFNQAIDRYRPEWSVPFEAYVRIVIRNRLLDWQRHLKTERHVLTMTDCEREDGQDFASSIPDANSCRVQEEMEFVQSMELLESQLEWLGLDLNRLVETFPRYTGSRLLCIQIARELTGDEALFSQLIQSRRFPAKELARRTRTPLKTLEKRRKSIILLALLLRSDLTVLQGYMNRFEEASHEQGYDPGH